MSFSPGSDACRPDDIQMELGTGHDEELREKLADSLSVRLQSASMIFQIIKLSNVCAHVCTYFSTHDGV